MHKNIPTVAGVKTRFLCTINGQNATLAGYVMVDGERYAMELSQGDTLTAPSTPPGDYLYEIRCGGATVVWGHLCARPSAFPPAEDVTTVALAAELSGETVVALSITLQGGPPGPQGPQGEPGAGATPEMVREALLPTYSTPAGTENAYFYYADLQGGIGTGRLTHLSIACMSQGNANLPTEPLYLALWQNNTLVGVSLNTQVHKPGGRYEYEFDALQISEGLIRFILADSPEGVWARSWLIGSRVGEAVTAGDKISLANATNKACTVEVVATFSYLPEFLKGNDGAPGPQGEVGPQGPAGGVEGFAASDAKNGSSANHTTVGVASVSAGFNSVAGSQSVTIGCGAASEDNSVSIGAYSTSKDGGVSIGSYAQADNGEIVLRAARTKNGFDDEVVEVRIVANGTKYSNMYFGGEAGIIFTDKVGIEKRLRISELGAAGGSGDGGVFFGESSSITIGKKASAGTMGIVLGNCSKGDTTSVVIGNGVKISQSNLGLCVIRAGDAGSGENDLLFGFFSGGSPLANQYTDGEAGMGFWDRNYKGEVKSGCVKLAEICTRHQGSFTFGADVVGYDGILDEMGR